jgi:signal transduction histidine kinase
MRNVAHHLLPDSLRRYGLRTALRDYCHSMKNVSFAYMGQEEHVPQEEVIYCIVYELVNNAVKNASAQHISVQLMAEPDFTAINVSDDGSGMANDPEGFGLQNIRERVAAANGKLDIFSQPGQGTEINIELPRNK